MLCDLQIYILCTMEQSNKVYSTTQVPMTLTKVKLTGQGQNFQKKMYKKKLTHLPYVGCYFIYILHTRYQVATKYGAFNDSLRSNYPPKK